MAPLCHLFHRRSCLDKPGGELRLGGSWDIVNRCTSTPLGFKVSISLVT